VECRRIVRFSTEIRLGHHQKISQNCYCLSQLARLAVTLLLFSCSSIATLELPQFLIHDMTLHDYSVASHECAGTQRTSTLSLLVSPSTRCSLQNSCTRYTKQRLIPAATIAPLGPLIECASTNPPLRFTLEVLHLIRRCFSRQENSKMGACLR
jgi:hypothetical protein